ncbi:MAG: Flp family type IVb pilin [Betaproteobacteria bacterium]|nr:Flp family type IVb pilin [Betaproteobacteria bacterium]
MHNIIQSVRDGTTRFVRDEEGAQVIEYALIIAVVSIALVVALQAVVTDASFTGFIGRIKTCLTAGSTCL